MVERLAAARRRREAALEQMAVARLEFERQDALVFLLTVRAEAGPGHIPLPDPDVLKMSRPVKDAPCCRVCGIDISSIAGKEPCPGDRRRCPAQVDVATETTYQQYGKNGLRCGARGSYAGDFRSWRCAHGHETQMTANSPAGVRHCTHDNPAGPQRTCLGTCPSWGLDVVVLPRTT